MDFVLVTDPPEEITDANKRNANEADIRLRRLICRAEGGGIRRRIGLLSGRISSWRGERSISWLIGGKEERTETGRGKPISGDPLGPFVSSSATTTTRKEQHNDFSWNLGGCWVALIDLKRMMKGDGFPVLCRSEKESKGRKCFRGYWVVFLDNSMNLWQL